MNDRPMETVRRKISIPVLVATVVVLAAAAGGFYFVRTWQLARLSQSLLVMASTAEQNEAWLDAARHLDRYLRLQPLNRSARTQLALTFARGATTLGDKQRAVALHRRALAEEAGERELTLRVGLADLLLETGRLLEAETEAQQVLDGLSYSSAQPDEQQEQIHAQASRVFALARYFQWRTGALANKRAGELKLLETIETALEQNPDDIALAEVTATLYREFPDVVAVYRSGLNQAGRQRVADAALDRVVKLRPQDAKAFLARHAYRAKYNAPGAADDLDKALQLAPDDPQVLLVAAGHSYREGIKLRGSEATNAQARAAFAAARRHYRQVIDQQLAPENHEAHLRLGDVLTAEDELDQAIAAWRDGASRFHRPTIKVVFHGRIADHLIQAGRIQESKPTLDAIDAILADIGGMTRRQDQLALMQAQGLRRATFWLHNGRYSDAIVELQQAIARQPQLQPNPKTSHDAWHLLGRGYAGLEDWSAAASAFDRAANFQQDAVASRLAAAQAWLSAGRVEMAADRAEQVISSEQGRGISEAWIIFAAAELQVQAMAPPVERRWEKMRAALNGLEQLATAENFPAPWRIDFLRADYVALEGERSHGRSAAADILRLAEVKHEDHPAFWFEVCLAYERLGQSTDAERAMERLNGIPGARTDAVIAASRRAAMHEDFAQATRILEAATQTVPPAEHVRLRQEMFRIAQSKQDLPAMKALLTADLRERPGDVGILCRLAEIDLREGNIAALRQWEDKLARAGPLGRVWARYFRVIRLYSTSKDPTDPQLQLALSEQAQLATLRPNWAEAFALRGSILQRMERWEAAAAAYEEAIQLGERRYAIFEQLIACLDQLKRTTEVEKYLLQLEAYLPTSQRLTEIATQHELHQDRPERAIELARQRVERNPGDLAARLWLGHMLLVTGRYSEAREAYEQATVDAPQDVRAWNGLFTYYLRTGEKERAIEVLELIRRHAKLDPVELDVVLGQAYYRLGDAAQAMRLFAALGEQAPDRADIQLQLALLYLDSDREKAKEHLFKAVELDPQKARPRHLLAAILAAGGSESEMAQAEELLSGTHLHTATEDRRVRALLLAQHGNAEDLNRAVQILEQIVDGEEGLANDRLLLAQFYERQAGATPDADKTAEKIRAARDQLVKVANRSRAQTGEMVILISFLLRHDEKDAAEAWLVRLEQRISSQVRSDPRALSQLIELRIRHGSVEQCEAWIAKLESVDHDPVRPLIAKVRYLAAVGKMDEIEPTVEARAATALEEAEEQEERTRIARAIGDLYLAVNHLDGAERWYRVVVREDRDQFPVLAVALMRKGRVREAIALCEDATEYDSSSRPAVVLTRILLQAGGKPEHIAMAEPMLAAALEKFPDDVELNYGVGMLRVFEDKYPEAIVLLQKVVQLNGRHIPALNNLSVLLAETPDQREEALELIDRAIELRGQQPTLLDTKGTILVFNGRSPEAMPLLEAATRKDSDPRHKFHLALAVNDVGSSERARELLKAAMEGQLRNQILTPTDHKSLERLSDDLNFRSL